MHQGLSLQAVFGAGLPIAVVPALFVLLWCRVAPACALLASLALRRPVLMGPALVAALVAVTLVPLSVAAPLTGSQPALSADVLSLAGIARALGLGLLVALVLAGPLLSMAWFGGAIGRSLGFAGGGEGLARLYGALSAALFFALGGHRMALSVLAGSLQAAPLLGAPGAVLSSLPAFVGGALTRALGWALLWAAPFWVSLWLFDGLLALSARFVGTTSGAPMAAPVRVAVGLCLLVAAGAFLVEAFPEALTQALEALGAALAAP